MKKDPSKKAAPENYEVGYRRPPESTRFKPGSSGNPKGRPKKPLTVGAIIESTLAKRVSVEENGRKKKISLEELIVRQVAAKAAKGDLKATQMLLQLKDRYQDSPAEHIDPEDLAVDQEILAAYAAQLLTEKSPAPPESADDVQEPETNETLPPSPSPIT
jgi:hypothetical protein